MVSGGFAPTPTNSEAAVSTTACVWAIAAFCLVWISRSVIGFCGPMPSTKPTADDSASVDTVTRNCSECRHNSPSATERRRPYTTSRPVSFAVVCAKAPSRSFIVQSPPSRRPPLIPDSANRQHHLRVFRVLLDLRPEPLHMDVHEPGVRGVAVAPDLLEEHLTGEHLTRLAGQRHRQVELQRGERDGPAFPGHLVPGDIDGEIADRQRLGRLGLRPAHPRAHPGYELLRLEGLDHVVIRPRLGAPHGGPRV